MRKIMLIFALILAFTGILVAQIIETFDDPKMEIAYPAIDHSTYSVVPNPDPSGINTSSKVLEFVHDKDGYFGQGIFFRLDSVVKMEKLYLHFKVWKPRYSDFFAHYWTTPHPLDPNAGNRQMNQVTSLNTWEEQVIELSPKLTQIYKFCIYPDILLNPDGSGYVRLTEDASFFIDDIYISSNPEPGSVPDHFLQDFETIPLNLMLGGAEDSSEMTMIPNPDHSGINLSSYVIQFQRDKDGVPWAGFWSLLPTPIDLSSNKFIHVKVWKSRISPLKFKIEDGADGDLEIESKYPQTKINEWEDIVFDFSGKTGSYSKIAFMPDFEDPLTLTGDDTIYFDDIVLNNDPEPRTPTQQVIHVDMREAGLAAGEKVFISGNFGGIYGNWTEPGTIPENEMTDPDEDGIYTINMHLADGLIEFMFHKGSEDSYMTDGGTANRLYTVFGNENLIYKWQVGGLMESEDLPKDLIFNVDMNEADLTPGQKVYISGTMGGIHGTWAEPGTIPENEMTDPDEDGIYSIAMSLPVEPIYFKFYKDSGWNGGEWSGDSNRACSVRADANLDYKWGINGLYSNVDDYNLVKQGHFDVDGYLFPIMEVPPWNGSSYFGNGVVEVIDGVLNLKPVSTGDNWVITAGQRLNDHGTMLYNDTTYMLMFDAWAEAERVFSVDLEDHSENNFKRFGLSTDADAVNGESQWDILLSTTRTTYIRTFTCNAILPNTTFNLLIMPGISNKQVYMDNVYLIKYNDIKRLGGEVTGLEITGEGGVSSIETDKGTLQMSAEFLPENTWIKSVEWSVISGTGKALIDASGMLTAISNGTVTVKAIARDGSEVSGTKEITLINQNKMELPIGFERMTDMAWEVFGNGASIPGDFTRTANPRKSKENPSQNVLKFVVNDDADPGTGAYSEAFVPLEFSPGTQTITMWVYKSIKSPTGFRVEQSTNGGPDTEVKVTTKRINVWEKLSFDFSSCIGFSYPRIVILPDYPDTRSSGTIVFIDSIELVTVPTGLSINSFNAVQVYPNPAVDELNVTLSDANAFITIYNSLGFKMEELEITGTQAKFDISGYPNGIYFVKANDAVVKFVK
ncbi:MAG: T9SS type A sorting domain-containing protein [Bacteroidales bacterium]